MEKWTVLSILKVTEKFFSEKGIDTARLDAEILLGYVLSMDRVSLYLNFDRPLTDDEVNRYREVVRRRAKREPVAYIVGEKEFYGRKFRVTPDVLIPRPETETLVETAIEIIRDFENKESLHVLELGAGSGVVVISLALQFPEVQFRATDVSSRIIEIAKENAKKYEVENVVFKVSNLCGECEEGFFDIIIFNPPYVSETDYLSLQPEVHYEPEIALVAPENGFYFYRRLLQDGKKYLKEKGHLLLEIGTPEERVGVEELARKEGWGDIKFKMDLAGFPRVAVVKKK